MQHEFYYGTEFTSKQQPIDSGAAAYSEDLFGYLKSATAVRLPVVRNCSVRAIPELTSTVADPSPQHSALVPAKPRPELWPQLSMPCRFYGDARLRYVQIAPRCLQSSATLSGGALFAVYDQ